MNLKATTETSISISSVHPYLHWRFSMCRKSADPGAISVRRSSFDSSSGLTTERDEIVP
jgi:hypothetical protein